MIKILLLLSLLFFSCSYEDDGPIPIYLNDDLLASGEGFFYSGSLDFNYPIHLFDDSLTIYLDSIWTFSNCSLSEIKMDASLVNDSLLLLSPRFIIEASRKDCAAPLFRPETTLSFSLASYKGVREIRLLNTKEKELDSISVYHGSFLKEKQSFYIDSAIADYSLWPFRISNEEASILRVLDSIKEQSYYWKSIDGKCAKIHDACQDSLLLDTLFPSGRWNIKDTALVKVIQTCEDTSKTFCLNKDWTFDSLNTGNLSVIKDTIRYSSIYYIASLSSCSKLISLTVLSSFSLKNTFTLQTDIFIPSSQEAYCNEELISNKIIYNLSLFEPVQDLQKAKELLDQWDSAYVFKSIDQEN